MVNEELRTSLIIDIFGQQTMNYESSQFTLSDYAECEDWAALN